MPINGHFHHAALLAKLKSSRLTSAKTTSQLFTLGTNVHNTKIAQN